MRRPALLLAILVFSSIIAGCGISGQMKKQARGVPERITSAEEYIKQQEAAFEKTKAQSESFAFYRPYEEREKWSGWFSDARQSIKNAKAIDKEIEAILKRNDRKEENALSAQLVAVSEQIRSARDFARKPRDRMSFLDMVKKDASKLVTEAKANLGQESTIFASLTQSVTKAESTYPGKKADLAKRLAVVKESDKNCRSAYACAVRELSSSQPDYAVLGDGCVLVGEKLGWIRNQDTQIRGKIDELGRSYSKTLVDMKQEFYVQVSRTSWDEYSDYGSETDYDYAKSPVDEETFEYFDSWPADDKIADYDGYYGNGLTAYADNRMWNNLGIDIQESWDGGHDSAEYYVGDTTVLGYHKYMVLENGKKTTTDWVPVSEAVFEKHLNDLGMEIVSKPYGVYESETITTAAPPGMAYVGNPAYGHWQSGIGGSRFWVWYAQYKFFETILGGSRYTYGDWDDWNRNYRGRRPYYGRNKEKDEDRWGSGSRYARTRYSNSDWARWGGLESEDGSVRTAGPSARGGGPGGGGK